MQNQNTSKNIILKQGKERSLARRHPWIFSGAVDSVGGGPGTGETVGVFSSKGEFLAWASFSPSSRIRARVWSFDRAEDIDDGFFGRKIRQAFEFRKKMGFLKAGSDSCRIVFSESDGLPGLIADKYGDTLVIQSLSAGTEYFKDRIECIIRESTGCNSVYERSDAEVRGLEGLSASSGLIHGDAIPDRIEINENGLKFLVDVKTGHKTGFYLDQRGNRLKFQKCSKGKRVLDCFCYTGGFTVNALAGGAESVISVDSSAGSLGLAKENVTLNGFAGKNNSGICGDVFEVLRDMVAEHQKYDLVALDPPKFAASRDQVEKAERAYKDVNMQALKLLSPGGTLFTFSCSGAIGPDVLQKIVAWSALDAGVDAKIIEKISQSPDHPIALNFPESEYLKGFIVRIK
jgi:23S rRNA (cytosine1962-C5)-methyltransferase